MVCATKTNDVWTFEQRSSVENRESDYGMLARKKKGNNYELKIIKLMKQLGFKRAVSSRAQSRNLDALGVDIVNTDPFLIQCKAWESAPSYHKVLSSMPQHKGKYNLVFHKRNNQGSVVVMTEEDFIELLEMLISNKIINPK